MIRAKTQPTEEMYRELVLAIDGTRLSGVLVVPEGAWGLVVMPQPVAGAHVSPRQGYLARLIRTAGLATALVDLVGPGAAERANDVFLNPPRLADRLDAWVTELRHQKSIAELPLALVAPGSAAASAAIAAARNPELAQVLVSYAGRPDLAHDALRSLAIPTLFLVGELDTPVYRFNRHALGHLRCMRRLEVIDGAHHLFAEPGALARVATHTRRWLKRYLPRTALPSQTEAAVILFPVDPASHARV